ncbi:MAG: hypothetical protein V4772_15100 [Pseudomonadota bacterium]
MSDSLGIKHLKFVEDGRRSTLAQADMVHWGIDRGQWMYSVLEMYA